MCGERIEGLRPKGGAYMTAEEVAARIRETHGRLICRRCQKEREQ